MVKETEDAMAWFRKIAVAPHAIHRALQGGFLGLGAPLGWLCIIQILGLASHDALYLHWLMGYMLVGTVLAFSLFGYIIGRHEQRFAMLSLLDPLTALFNKRHFTLCL